jgi:hypothetical protein
MSNNNDVPLPDYPAGAIINGTIHADRLESMGFECEAGPLGNCVDWQGFRQCFNHLAEYVQLTAAALATQRAAEPDRAALTDGVWTIIGPDGSRFEGPTPLKAALPANKHRIAVDPAAAAAFSQAIEEIRQEGEEERVRMLALHGSLDCPACGGSGHVGDVEASVLFGDIHQYLKDAPDGNERARALRIRALTLAAAPAPAAGSEDRHRAELAICQGIIKGLTAELDAALAAASEAPGTQDGEALAEARHAAIDLAHRASAAEAKLALHVQRLRPVAPEATEAPMADQRRVEAAVRTLDRLGYRYQAGTWGYSGMEPERRKHLRTIIERLAELTKLEAHGIKGQGERDFIDRDPVMAAAQAICAAAYALHAAPEATAQPVALDLSDAEVISLWAHYARGENVTSMDTVIRFARAMEAGVRSHMRHSAPAQKPAEPTGRCCYGGIRPRSACGSCGAWEPIKSSYSNSSNTSFDTAPSEALARAMELFSEALQCKVRSTVDPSVKTFEEEGDALEAMRIFLSQHLRAPWEDTERLDWMEMQVVEVRTPLVYGSRANFITSPEQDDPAFPAEPSDLRKRIDAAKGAA